MSDRPSLLQVELDIYARQYRVADEDRVIEIAEPMLRELNDYSDASFQEALSEQSYSETLAGQVRDLMRAGRRAEAGQVLLDSLESYWAAYAVRQADAIADRERESAADDEHIINFGRSRYAQAA